MDNLDLIFDMTERPMDYDSVKVAEIMSDHEAADAYELLCRVCGATVLSAACGGHAADVENEWQAFRRANAASQSAWRRMLPFRRFLRVASIVAVVCVSLAGAAAGIILFTRHSVPQREADAATEANGAVPGIIVADSAATPADSAQAAACRVFDNVPLDSIMQAVALRYGMTVSYKDDDVASLPMFYIFDSSLALDEVVDRLNTFGRINIAVHDSTLEVSGE